MFQYPTGYDDVHSFEELTGGFWSWLFGGSAEVTALCRSYQAAERQQFQSATELEDSVGAPSCPIFHVQLWYVVPVLKSQEQFSGGVASYPVPAEVVDFTYAADAILQPDSVLVQGVDCDLSAGRLRVVGAGLFNDPAFASVPVLTDGQQDFQTTIWLFQAQLDLSYIYRQFGYLTGLQAASSSRYRDFVAAVLNAYAAGTTYDAVCQVLAAVADVPFALGDETVVDVSADAVHQLIITDQNAYTFSLAANPIVSIGQVIHRGDPLTDAVRLWEPSNGLPPPYLTQISLSGGLLSPGLSGPLTFTNASTPLVVTTNVSGYTMLSWALGGAPGDVTAFFVEMHAKGVAAGQTLANLLDLRTVKVGQPDATMLPVMINPFQFLFANVLRNNCLVVVLRRAAFGSFALDPSFLAVLRQVVPPHTTVLLIWED